MKLKNRTKEKEKTSAEFFELTEDELADVSGGAMIVNHNMAAINTLTQLSKNQSSLSKSLTKLSSGMKVNSSADDPSGYQISERMRVQIRSLDQANYSGGVFDGVINDADPDGISHE